MFGLTSRSTRSQPSFSTTSLPPIIQTWKRSPKSALSMQWYDGKVRWQLYPPCAYKDEWEFGPAVAAAMGAENAGRDWHREDAVIVRAVKAVSGLAFADFIDA